MTAEDLGNFPPNTLYRLDRVREAGEWEAPGGTRVQRRLLMVRATYLSSPSAGSEQCHESKMVRHSPSATHHSPSTSFTSFTSFTATVATVATSICR